MFSSSSFTQHDVGLWGGGGFFFFFFLYSLFMHWAYAARHTHESLYSSISHENSNDSTYDILDFPH